MIGLQSQAMQETSGGGSASVWWNTIHNPQTAEARDHISRIQSDHYEEEEKEGRTELVMASSCSVSDCQIAAESRHSSAMVLEPVHLSDSPTSPCSTRPFNDPELDMVTSDTCDISLDEHKLCVPESEQDQAKKSDVRLQQKDEQKAEIVYPRWNNPYSLIHDISVVVSNMFSHVFPGRSDPSTLSPQLSVTASHPSPLPTQPNEFKEFEEKGSAETVRKSYILVSRDCHGKQIIKIKEVTEEKR